jgi:hypothetical protein
MSPPPAAAAPSTAPTGGGPRGPKSKAYSSTVAVQTNATKYRGKYKELKKRVSAIERVSEVAAQRQRQQRQRRWSGPRRDRAVRQDTLVRDGAAAWRMRPPDRRPYT